MAVVAAGWQFVPALVVVTLAVAGYRSLRGLSFTDGDAPSLVGALHAAPVPAP
jgi:hypothetical protein